MSVPVSAPVVSPVESAIIMKNELKGIARKPNPTTTIVDARSLEEYLGKEISGIPRPGHIPGAVHVAWSGFLNADATVKDLAPPIPANSPSRSKGKPKAKTSTRGRKKAGATEPAAG